MDTLTNVKTSNQIEKSITINASRSRVWRALTNYQEFGAWFNVRLDSPFVVGKPCEGKNLHPGYEHLRMLFTATRIEPEDRFAYTWHPFPIDVAIDYSKEEPTLVEFALEETAGGTLLRVTESGFDHIPAYRRAEAFRMNTGGWEAQMQNIVRYAEAHP